MLRVGVAVEVCTNRKEEAWWGDAGKRAPTLQSENKPDKKQKTKLIHQPQAHLVDEADHLWAWLVEAADDGRAEGGHLGHQLHHSQSCRRVCSYRRFTHILLGNEGARTREKIEGAMLLSIPVLLLIIIRPRT